jgi:hypothetical protein
MARRGSRVSSLSVAAASNPAKDRKPKMAPFQISPRSIPAGATNTSRVNVWPPGAVPPMTLTRTTSAMARISASVIPSADSRTRVTGRVGRVATHQPATRMTGAITNGAHRGGWFQTPMASRNAVPKIPAVVPVTTARNT